MEHLKGFREKAEENLAKLGQAGMAVSVVKDGETVFSGGFGYRDIENKRQPDSRTLFPIGSATKSFTAAALIILKDRGKIDLDKPVREYMGELQFFDPAANREATTRDILSHRTGLPRHDMLWLRRPYISRAEMPTLIRHLEPSKPFRTAYQYNNLMYICAGRLVEVLDGRRWEDFVRQEIFAPLGINRANFSADDSIVDGNFAICYERDPKTKELNYSEYTRFGGLAPAGAINADVTEMAEWTKLFLGRGKYGGKEIISEAGCAELIKPNTYIPPEIFNEPEIRSMGYALGWEVEDFRGYKLIQHGGNVSGSSAIVAFIPEINAGVTVLVNTGSSVLTYATMYDVFDRLLGRADEKDWAGALGGVLEKLIEKALGGADSLKAAQKPVKTAREPKEFAGVYTHPAYGAVRVEAGDGGLSARFTARPSALENLHYDIFIAKIDFAGQEMPVPVIFNTGIDGSIVSFEAALEGSVAPILFRKEK